VRPGRPRLRLLQGRPRRRYQALARRLGANPVQTPDGPVGYADLVTLDGWGHTSEAKSSCTDAHISRYLVTTRTPHPGTVCQPDIVPFAHPSTQTAGLPTKPARS
jgi:hypothetical protein